MKSLANELRQNIAEVLNASELEIDMKYYILKDILLEVDNLYSQFLRMEDKNIKTEEVQTVTEEEKKALEEANKIVENDKNFIDKSVKTQSIPIDSETAKKLFNDEQIKQLLNNQNVNLK